MRFSLRTLLAVSVLAGLTIVAGINCIGPIRPHSAVAKISQGMTQEDVRKILGPPNGRVSQESWSHQRFLNPGWLVVYFDDAGCVQYVEHEPPFP
jgi:outer membrane protein assembly factor BamE (lipoprotein component of BamABCDE complex)